MKIDQKNKSWRGLLSDNLFGGSALNYSWSSSFVLGMSSRKCLAECWRIGFTFSFLDGV
jgi:hypothetical protein